MSDQPILRAPSKRPVSGSVPLGARTHVVVSGELAHDGLDAACDAAGLELSYAQPDDLMAVLEKTKVDALLLSADDAGLAMLRALREDPRWDGLPVMLVMSEGAVLPPEAAVAAGADELLFEPLRPGELRLRLCASAHRHRQRLQAEEALQETATQLEESLAQMRQAQKMESIGRLAGGVAHDFNNLLTSIISFSRFVMDDLAPGDPRRSDLGEVLRAADSASKLTSQLLAFSRQRPVDPIAVELNAALTNIHSVLRRTVGEHVEIVIVPAEREHTVLFDPGQLDQVIMNLAVNARDAMPEGGTFTLTVDGTRVGRHTELPPGKYVVLSFSDTGSGMAADVVQQIFEPFFSTKGELGTGLGLSTVYGIVKQANGHIEVKSAPGTGTTFTIWLPVATGPGRRAISTKVTSPQAARLTGLALIVEDQPAILRTMNRSLKAAGLTVLEAHSAEEALALIEDLNAEVDLLVTDVVLPGLSGPKLAARMRETQPGLRVLVCSGYMGEDGAAGIALDERTDFLPKPFTGPQLVSKVGALFD